VPDPQELNFYNDVHANSDEIDFEWRDKIFPVWVAEYNISTYAVSVQENQSSPVYDYYLLQLEGFAAFQTGDSAWRLDAHAIQVFPKPGGKLPSASDHVRMIDHAPTTTIGATTYSTSMSQQVIGSVGYFGRSTVQGQTQVVTATSSKVYTISDLSIRDTSLMGSDPPVDGSWAFEVANDSPVQSSECPIAVAVLYRLPHGQLNLEIDIYYSVYLSGGDLDQLGSLQGVDVITGFHNPNDPWLRNKSRLSSSKRIGIPPPPAPLSAR
jgi:hypothetical protein